MDKAQKNHLKNYYYLCIIMAKKENKKVDIKKLREVVKEKRDEKEVTKPNKKFRSILTIVK